VQHDHLCGYSPWSLPSSFELLERLERKEEFPHHIITIANSDHETATSLTRYL